MYSIPMVTTRDTNARVVRALAIQSVLSTSSVRVVPRMRTKFRLECHPLYFFSLSLFFFYLHIYSISPVLFQGRLATGASRQSI